MTEEYSNDYNHDRIMEQRNAILEFMGKFQYISTKPKEIFDLCDGVAFNEALHEISPDYFDIKTITNVGDNWVLKTSNLRKLLRSLESYFHKELGKDADFSTCSSFVPEIAKSSSIDGIISIFELVAAAAVSCDERNYFVEMILSMEEVNQVYMKEIIQRSLERLTDFHFDPTEEEKINFISYQDNSFVTEMGSPYSVSPPSSSERKLIQCDSEYLERFGVNLLNESVDRNNNDQELKINEVSQQLEEEKHENTALYSQIRFITQEAEQNQEKLHSLIDKLEEQLAKKENENRSLSEDLFKLEKKLEDVDKRSIDLEAERQQLMDELDLANAKSMQLHKAEAKILVYQKRQENFGDFGQQMIDLENQTESYLRKIVDLESTCKRVPVLEERIHDLQNKLGATEIKHKKEEESLQQKEAKNIKLKNELVNAEQKANMYKTELLDLREQQKAGNEAEKDMNTVSDLSLSCNLSMTETRESKEKTLRLKIENGSLKEQNNNLQKRMNQFLNESCAESQGLSSSVEDPEEFEVIHSQLKHELKKTKEQSDKLQEEKEKLEKYTKNSLAKFQGKYLVALSECKSKLKEKQDKIENLERRSARERESHKREEKLLSTTIYELGLAVMQQNQLRGKRI